MDSTKTSKKVTNVTQNQTNSATKSGSNKEAPSVIDSKWILRNIKLRRCIHFVASEEDKKICLCGYEKECHKNIQSNKSNSDKSIISPKWDFSKHTKTEQTNAFGEIEFDGCTGDRKPKFVRVEIETEMSVILEMIKREGMENPKLLISVVGDIDESEMKIRLQKGGDSDMKIKLQDGLLKAAHRIGAWVITGGTMSRYMESSLTPKVMPLKNYKSVVFLGIAPWGVIHNRKALEHKNMTMKYKIGGTLMKNEKFLDPYHSHFILVDNGTQHKLEIEIPFRENLEQEIAKMKSNTRNDALMVILVLGGGEGTLKTVEKALKQDKPAIVVKGSGGAADILAYAFEHVTMVDEDNIDNNGQDSNRTQKHMTEILKGKIEEKLKKKQIKCGIDVIEDCLLKSDLIHIFDLNSDEYNIDAVLLKALLRANNGMKSQIATDKTHVPFTFDDMMMNALQFEKADSVELLLENGVDLKKFLTTERLQTLCNVSLKRIFKDFRSKKNGEKIRLNDVRRLVQDLIGGNYLQHYMNDKNANEGQKKDKDKKAVQSTDKDGIQKKDQDANEFQRHIQENKLIEEKNKKENGEKEERKSVEEDLMTIKNPYLDLLIWSVLSNQQDKAKLFWRHVEDKIAAALVAHALFCAMSRKTDDRDLREAIDKNSNEFMTLAIKVAKRCSKVNETLTQCLLTRTMEQWGNTTCIEIAVNAHNKGFISLKVCEDLFNKIWMGGLKSQNSVLNLLFCIVFPPLILRLASFEKEEDNQQNSSNHQTKNHGHESLCCFSSKLRKVCAEIKRDANDRSDNITNSSSDKASDNSCGEKEGKCQNARGKLTTFYSAPIIIFMHNIISFLAFLLLYSYVLVSKLEPQMTAIEICLVLFVGSFVCEEIMQVSTIEALTLWKKFKRYIADGWNVLDMLTILLFTIGMVLLMSNPHPVAVEFARVILGVDLMLFFLRILHTFHAHRQVGPKLVMILNMVRDLGSLAAIIGVVILAYAIASYAILYPNTALSIDTLMKILKRPYWNIYGELLLEEIEGEDNCSDNEALYGNGAVPRCPTKAGQYAVPVMMGIYMLMTNILLLSLLIATFSYSIEKVQQHTNLHCSIHRYNLICEYCTKPWLAHPFALFIYLPQIMFGGKGQMKEDKKICLPRWFLSAFNERDNPFKQTFKKEFVAELSEFEELHAAHVYQRMEQTRPESINSKHKKTGTRLEQMVSTMNKTLQKVVAVKKPMQPKSNLMQQILTGATNLEKKVGSMEKQINIISGQLQSVIDSLRDHKFETKQNNHEDKDEK